MKKKLLTMLIYSICMLTAANTNAQSIKVGVFDMDVMVQAMPGYRMVDSLIRIYEADSLAIEYQYYQNEYQRLDSTYKADSVLVVTGKKPKALLDFTTEERRKTALNILYWQQIAQNKSSNKRNQLAQPLYTAVVDAYKKVLARKKYTLILRPQTYEAGFTIDNIFIAVAKELKLAGLPQELLYLGDDPDAVKTPAKPATGNKPKTN